MATNPETLLPNSQNVAASREQGRAAIRAYLLQNKGRATLQDVQSIGSQFGLTVPDAAQAAIDWANQEGTDVNLIPITTDVLAEAGQPVAADITAPPPPEGTMFEGVPFLEGVYTPEVLGQGLLDSTVATGKGVANAITGPYDLLNLAAGGVQQGVNYLLTEGEALGRSALGLDPEAARRLGAAQAERISQATETLSPRAAMDRIIATPQGYENLEFGTELAAGLVTPIVPFAPRVAPPIRAPRPGLRTPAAAAPEAGVPSPVPQAPELPPAVPRAAMTAPQRAEALGALEQKGQTQPVMKLGLSRKAANFAADYLNEAGLTRPNDVPFTQFFYDHFTAGTLPDETVERLFKQYDMTPIDVVEAATGLRASASELGRGLGLLSQISRLVPTEAAEIARLGAKTQPDPSLWVRAGNTMRGLLVSQVATTMRNVVGTAARAAPVGLDPFVRTVDNLVNASLNPVRKLRGEEAVPVNPLDAWVLTTQQFKPKQNDAIFRQLRNAQPKINKKLLSAYSPDVTRPILNDKFGKVEKAVDTLNIFNRASEYVTRRAAFPAFLRRETERKGLDFDALVENNELHTIPSDIMERALNETLDLVYARRPAAGGPLFLGKTSQKIVDFVEDMGPIGASVVGFPNFIANALRFQFEHSPAGFLRLLSKNERNRLMKGDSDVIGKAVAGSAMLYTAMQFQDSEYAGSKWFNMRLPDGREVDLRPFFPAAPYLLMADLIKRYEDGTLDVAYTAADILQGFSGAQFRAGGGLYAVDQLMRDLVQAGSIGEGAMAAVSGILGNAIGGVLTPLSTLKDVIAQFRPEEAVVRDVSEAPLLGPALRNVPFAQTELLGLPEQEYVSQEAPRTTDEPLLRQLTGAAIRPAPTIIQDEMRDLGFEDYDIYKKEGFPALDRRAKEIIGSIADYNADAFFGSEAYQAADSLTKRELFKEYYKGVRGIARDAIKQENPAYAALMYFQDQSREDKIRLNNEYKSSTGMDFKAFFSQLAKAPLIQTEEEFSALPAGAKYTDPGDYKVYTKK